MADPFLVSVRLQFTGSQESILHLDIEEVAAFGLVDSPHPGRGRLQGQGLQPAREPQSPSPQQPATPQHDEDPQSATRVSTPVLASATLSPGLVHKARPRCLDSYSMATAAYGASARRVGNVDAATRPCRAGLPTLGSAGARRLCPLFPRDADALCGRARSASRRETNDMPCSWRPQAQQTQQQADDADVPGKCLGALGAAEAGDLDADLTDGDKDARCQPSRPTRATSPGGLSSASVASSGSVSSCCSDGSGNSGNSVTHSILPQAKRPHIVATCHGTCHAACQQPSDLSPPQ